MHSFGVIVLLGLAVLSSSFPQHLDKSRIVGGQDAKLGQFKHQVSLRSYGSHFCGGSIISKRTILTAAHCRIGELSQMTAVVGTITLQSGGVAHGVSSFIQHPGWNPNTLENDIAVVILSDDIEFNDNVGAIKLPSSPVGGGVELETSGWGLTSYPGSLPNTLQWFVTRTLTKEDCRKLHSGNLFDSQICVLTQRGQGVCSGDSGGPMINENGEIHGVTSAAYLCALGLPDFFTRVSSFKSWVEENSK